MFLPELTATIPFSNLELLDDMLMNDPAETCCKQVTEDGHLLFYLNAQAPRRTDALRYQRPVR